jgi:glucose uptake protein GlcU
VLDDTFSDVEVLKGSLDISVHTEVWDEVVHIVLGFLGVLVLVLGATCRVADWV